MREAKVHTCHICGAIITSGMCASCGHQQCSECPVYVPEPTREEMSKRIAALEAELAAMTADRNLYRDDHDGEGHPLSEVVALRNELREAKQECERLNKMRTHCENCGADYMATGIEAGCPCKLQAENATLALSNEGER